MKTTKISLVICFVWLGLSCQFVASQPTATKIQLALLLDTSNSMDGLIDQAKAQLWNIVNEMSKARMDGSQPTLEIGLYHYGNSGLSSRSGYIEQISGFTTDLDLISEKLFALTTNGGQEYCGHVIRTSLDQLEWSREKTDLKIITIAGNEAFTQGNVSYVEACSRAISEGVIVNTIFCGDHLNGINGKWKHGADLASGKYMNIDHTQAVVFIATPFDVKITTLNDRLNKTYVPFGASGAILWKRQSTQDTNASSYGRANVVNRAVTKASSSYRNSTWDLVDACKDRKFDLTTVADKDLPKEMKGMSESEKKAYLEAKSKERSKIQEEIRELNKERNTWLVEERKKNSQANTLDAVLTEAFRKQASSNGFSFAE